jgi:transcription antitermination protein NusB
MARRRHLSRVAVLQVLFEREVRPDIDIDASLARNIVELGEVDEELAQGMLQGIVGSEETLKVIIQEHAPGWTLERMDPISRCTLELGVWELSQSKDAPAPVVINEAIEIAKEFASDEAGKFVNGVLNAVAQKYRPGESRQRQRPASEAPAPATGA